MPRLSEEQIQQARSVELLEYLKAYEPSNVRKSGSGEYCMVEHDSLKMSNGKWFRHSTQQGGYSALDFLVKVRGVHFVDAVMSLTSGYVPESDRKKAEQKSKPQESAKQPAPPKPFMLPKPNKNCDRVVAYLRGRGISKTIINRCITAGLLYESAAHRCVFVGKDENGKARFACERGTEDERKKDVAGSSKIFSFTLPPEIPSNNSTLAVFESPADSLAHFTIHEMGQTGWDGYRLSLGGVQSAALYGFLERNPQITSVQLCLDNDNAGQDATNRIIKEVLSDKRYAHVKITLKPPPFGKDYADTVLAIKKNSIEKSTMTRPREAVF
jgi:hypothetical protein